jgi:hypothetical protein
MQCPPSSSTIEAINKPRPVSKGSVMSKVSFFCALALVLASVSLPSGPASASQAFNLDFLNALPRKPAPPSQAFNFDFLKALPKPAPAPGAINWDFLKALPKH